ncbi:MAG: RluA family pseudouridine synthase [Bacteroidetes bacterium]|nr:RluA family pseudouridine synthase [Bacteroidota bacterium]
MENFPLQPLYDDPDYIIFNKPSGLLALPDGYDRAKTNMRDLLIAQYGKIFIVHRLDKDTSGVICFAKNEDAHRQLNRQFESRTVKKAYHALVSGILPEKSGVIRQPIAPFRKEPGLMRVDTRGGKESETFYEVMEEFPGHPSYSLVLVKPKTGRTHQIRVHFQFIGHPLAIDPLYGNPGAIFLSGIKRGYKKNEDVNEKPLIDRLTLHGKELSFIHFRTGNEINIKAPLPKDFAMTLKMLRKYAVGKY